MRQYARPAREVERKSYAPWNNVFDAIFQKLIGFQSSGLHLPIAESISMLLVAMTLFINITMHLQDDLALRYLSFSVVPDTL